MDTAQLLVTILGAGGGGAALLAMIKGLLSYMNGSAGRERDKNTDLIAQRRKAVEERDTAEKARDEADVDRRAAYEYASQLRRQLIEAGLDPVQMKPEAPNTESKYKGSTDGEHHSGR